MTIDDLPRKSQSKFLTLCMVAILAAFAMVVQGYHPGQEDDGVYLAAIQSDLNPQLFPHDAQFFRVQMQASVYDRVMAESARLTHLPVNVTMFCWQFCALAFVLWCCLRVGRRMFAAPQAACAGAALVAVLLPLPVAGTALFVLDPQLHPRTLATGLIVLAMEAVLVRRSWVAVPLLVLAGTLHPIMAAFGISFCAWLWLVGQMQSASSTSARKGHAVERPAFGFAASTAAAAEPRSLSWLLEKPTAEWRQAMGTRHYIFLFKWEWYEWLGAIAPSLLLAWCWRWAARQRRAVLAQVAGALVCYCCFQLAFAIVVSAVPAFVRVLPLQPMRFLHLVYLLGIVIAGSLLGEFVLRNKAWRWAALLLPLAAAMFTVEHSLWPATPQLELPGIRDGSHSTNGWVQAFAWIAANTPTDAYFAVDPNYMALPGEDYHGFRALALRSVLADNSKDSAVAMQVPRLAPVWLQQVTALQGFRNFGAADFQRLHRQFGVSWTVLPAGRELGFDCPYHNQQVQVCRLP
jgi:hypothetical protein